MRDLELRNHYYYESDLGCVASNHSRQNKLFAVVFPSIFTFFTWTERSIDRKHSLTTRCPILWALSICYKPCPSPVRLITPAPQVRASDQASKFGSVWRAGKLRISGMLYVQYLTFPENQTVSTHVIFCENSCNPFYVRRPTCTTIYAVLSIFRRKATRAFFVGSSITSFQRPSIECTGLGGKAPWNGKKVILRPHPLTILAQNCPPENSSSNLRRMIISCRLLPLG